MTLKDIQKQLENALQLVSKSLNDMKNIYPEEANNIEDAKESWKYCVFLDAGHGGRHPETGQYMTPPQVGKVWDHKKGRFHNGSIFYEGVFNRTVAQKVKHKLTAMNINVIMLNHDYEDTPLSLRTKRANDYHVNEQKGVLVSIHSNAHNTQARGWSIWTSQGQTNSDILATVIHNKCKEMSAGKFAMREQSYIDNDPDYEAPFWMLTKSAMPAVLIEHLFFDNFEDAKLLMREDIQNIFADSIVYGILYYQNNF